MPCCAFVAFLVSQLCFFFRWTVRLAGRTPSKVPAAMWRPGVVRATADRAGPLQQLRRRAGPAWLAVAAVELCVLLGGAHWFAFAGGRQMLTEEWHRLLAGSPPPDHHMLSGHDMPGSPGSTAQPTHAPQDR